MKLWHDFGVRALLATLTAGGAITGSLWLIIWGEQPELGMGFLASAAMAGLGFYFGQRSNHTTP